MVDRVFKKIQGTGFDLEKEGEDGDLAGYLRIDLGKEGDGSIHMTQIGLIERIIEALSSRWQIQNIPQQPKHWDEI